jgi:hypothetical protein
MSAKWFAFAFLVPLGLWAGWPAHEPAPNIELLASDAHLIVGSQRLTIPFVAIAGSSQAFSLSNKTPDSLRMSIAKQASDPTKPFPLKRLRLNIEQYQYHGEHTSSSGICPRLTRLWWREVCEGKGDDVARHLPRTFEILDGNELALLKNTTTVGRENLFNQISTLELLPGVTAVACDEASKFCAAALEARPGLVAVWTVWNNPERQETARQMARPQGAALVEFFKIASTSPQ